MKITHQELLQFCRGLDRHITRRTKDACYEVFKHFYDDNTLVLFCGYSYTVKDGMVGLTPKSDMSYCGFYSKITNQLYDVDYRFSPDESNPMEITRLTTLENIIKATIKPWIIAFAKSKPKEFKAFLTDRIDEYDVSDSSAKNIAQSAYMQGLSKLDLFPRIDPNVKFQDIVEYISRPNDVTERIARAVINDRIYDLTVNFTLQKKAQKILDEMNNDPKEPLKTKRDLTRLPMKLQEVAPSRKTVDVTIEKDGLQITFQQDVAKILSGKMGLPTKIREAFIKLYGNGKDFGPEDIITVKCGKQVLYGRSK